MIESFHPYSVDDLLIYDITSAGALDLQKLEGSNSAYIESDLPYYVDIIGENKRIYLDKYGTKNAKYPHEADFDTSNIKINKDLYENCSVDDVVDIRYYAEKLAPNDPKGVEWEAMKLLQDGFSIEGVINIMKETVTKTVSVRDKRLNNLMPKILKEPKEHLINCSNAAMRFIADYPHLRRYMITYANDRTEVFDVIGAKMFPRLLETCGGDEKLAHRILWDCRKEMEDGSFLSDIDLLTLGQRLYITDGAWSPQKAKIVQLVSLKKEKLYKRYANKVLDLQKRMSLDEVIENITLRTSKKQVTADVL